MQQISDNKEDRRSFKRVATTAIVEVTPAGQDTPPEHIRVETLDMSPGGILFCSDSRFEIGTRWKMKILLEESQTLNAGWELKNFQLDRPTVSAICTVVRVHGAEEIGYEIAVEFESIDEDHAAEVKKFLEEL